jgi:hypothetical protein
MDRVVVGLVVIRILWGRMGGKVELLGGGSLEGFQEGGESGDC